MSGGITGCFSHRFLCVLLHSTRSRPVPVQLRGKRFSPKLSLVPKAYDSSTFNWIFFNGCSFGFGAYFNLLPGSEWSAIMLTYGFPLVIIGMALKYEEFKSVPCLTFIFSKLEGKIHHVLSQVNSDVTRFAMHLDEALKLIFQYGQSSRPIESIPTSRVHLDQLNHSQPVRLTSTKFPNSLGIGQLYIALPATKSLPGDQVHPDQPSPSRLAESIPTSQVTLGQSGSPQQCAYHFTQHWGAVYLSTFSPPGDRVHPGQPSLFQLAESLRANSTLIPYEHFAILHQGYKGEHYNDLYYLLAKADDHLEIQKKENNLLLYGPLVLGSFLKPHLCICFRALQVLNLEDKHQALRRNPHFTEKNTAELRESAPPNAQRLFSNDKIKPFSTPLSYINY
ncbi:hypothetical protein CR513_21554, partial [Mucuna pruriens]